MTLLLPYRRPLLGTAFCRNELWKRARAVPSLDLPFADTKSLADAVTGQSLVTFTRASSGTYVDSTGTIRTATTNLLLRSEEFNDASWSKSNSTVVTDSTIAPNGTLTAEKLITNSGASSGRVSASITATADTSATLSCYAKQGETNIFGLFISDGVTGRAADFNLTTGTVSGTPTTGMTASIQPVGNGWYRCVATVAAASLAGTTRSVRIVQTVVSNDGTSGVFIWGAQLEQSSTVGEYIPTTSTINSAPRFDHNPTTGESLGLLVEEQRTNLVTWSQDFSQTDWSKNASTIVATAVASPIQGVNYQKIEATSANTTVGITSVAVTAATQQRAVSFFAQPLGNISRVLVVVQGADARININLADGTFTTNATATGSTVSVSGQRFSVSTPTLANATGVRLFLKRTGETDTNTPTTIAIGEGLYLIGAQMEAGSFPTSYIPTTTATATRSADVASITGTAFSPWYRQDEGTWLAHHDKRGVLLNVSNNSFNERNPQMGLNSAIAHDFYVITGGVIQANNVGSTHVMGAADRAAYAMRTNDFIGAINGTLTAADTSGSVSSSASQLNIGTLHNSGAGEAGTIRRLTYWPARLSNSTLQAITQ